MRPGKPLIFGRLGQTPLLGLPGNPVSTLVCAMLFLQPAIAAMLGTKDETLVVAARLATSLKANDTRQDYIRARIELRDGEQLVEPFAVQDFLHAEQPRPRRRLIVRPPHAPAEAAGATVSILPLE